MLGHCLSGTSAPFFLFLRDLPSLLFNLICSIAFGESPAKTAVIESTQLETNVLRYVTELKTGLYPVNLTVGPSLFTISNLW